ncbi:Unknown protein, partial [Striga hermonthica]
TQHLHHRAIIFTISSTKIAAGLLLHPVGPSPTSPSDCNASTAAALCLQLRPSLSRAEHLCDRHHRHLATSGHQPLRRPSRIEEKPSQKSAASPSPSTTRIRMSCEPQQRRLPFVCSNLWPHPLPCRDRSQRPTTPVEPVSSLSVSFIAASPVAVFLLLEWLSCCLGDPALFLSLITVVPVVL